MSSKKEQKSKKSKAWQQVKNNMELHQKLAKFRLELSKFEIERPAWEDETLWLTDLTDMQVHQHNVPSWELAYCHKWRRDPLAGSYVLGTKEWAEKRLANQESNRALKEARVQELLEAIQNQSWRAEITRVCINGLTGRVITGQHILEAIVRSGLTMVVSVSVTYEPEIYARVEGRALAPQSLSELCTRIAPGTFLEKYLKINDNDEDIIDVLTKVGVAMVSIDDRGQVPPYLKDPRVFIEFLALFQEHLEAVVERLLKPFDGRTSWDSSYQKNARTLAACVVMRAFMKREDWELAMDVLRGAIKEYPVRFEPMMQLRNMLASFGMPNKRAFHECYLYVMPLVAMQLIKDEKFAGMVVMPRGIWQVGNKLCQPIESNPLIVNARPIPTLCLLPGMDWCTTDDQLCKKSAAQLRDWYHAILPNRPIRKPWYRELIETQRKSKSV